MQPSQYPSVVNCAPDAPAARVLVVDDHAATLAAIAALLDRESPLIEVVGIARCSDGVMRVLREAAPDVVVLDLDLGGECGLDLLPMIHGHPGVAVIILTASDDPLDRARALAAGAAAFVSKLSPAAELIDAILAIGRKVTGIGGLSQAGGTA